jgi:predicted HTH domain antitoxin
MAVPISEEQVMPVVSINLPAEVFSALRRSPEEFAQEMRLAAAIHWYSRGEVSQEKAAAIAGLDRSDFLAALAREKVDVFNVCVYR